MTSSNHKPHLSKSLFIKGLQCHKALYLDRNHPELRDEISEAQQALFEGGSEVGLYAQKLFPDGVNIPYEGLSPKEQLTRTQDAITEGARTIYEATFSFDNIFVKADILNRGRDGWHLYEVKATTKVQDNYIDDVAVQYYVLAGSGLPVKKASLVHLNNQYVRKGNIEFERLFKIEDLTDAVKEKQASVAEQVSAMRKMLEAGDIPSIDIGEQCANPYPCDFHGHCWQHIPENSVFDLHGRGVNKFGLYQQGILYLKDIPLEMLKKSQRMQVEAFLERKTFINPKGLKSFLDSLWYPRYFLDFETFKTAIPTFDGTRPYQEIPFQYSLHSLDQEGAELQHYEFLAQPNTDPRRELLEKLLKEIPEEACVLAYNMTFENKILRFLGEWFPEYQEKIKKITEHMLDPATPFQKKDFYHWQMFGSYSLKKVLPIMVPDLSYERMEISEGGMASEAYFKMNELQDPGELERLHSALLEYCRLDTLAMVKILEKLGEILGGGVSVI
jgi:hypothetical protein